MGSAARVFAEEVCGRHRYRDLQSQPRLRDRERQLLLKIPQLLKSRFEHLFKDHQQKLADTEQTDNPMAWTQAGGWLARFCNDMQMLLLAELELRLQPTMGLIEAINDESKQDTLSKTHNE